MNCQCSENKGTEQPCSSAQLICGLVTSHQCHLILKGCKYVDAYSVHFSLEDGLRRRKQANIEEMKKLPLLDTEVTLKSSHKGKTKTSIPYNAMTSEKFSGNRGQTRYRTRANSSEQAGLLESAQSSQRSSVEVLSPHSDSTEKIQLVDMNTMPDI